MKIILLSLSIITKECQYFKKIPFFLLFVPRVQHKFFVFTALIQSSICNVRVLIKFHSLIYLFLRSSSVGQSVPVPNWTCSRLDVFWIRRFQNWTRSGSGAFRIRRIPDWKHYRSDTFCIKQVPIEKWLKYCV